jgi:peptide/nickel transport system permease protein
VPRYLARRLVGQLFVLVGVSLAVFVISRAIPGDPAAYAVGLDAGPAQIAAMRARMGLDKPVPLQYVYYMRNLLHGDLGYAVATRRPVIQDIGLYLPASVELALCAQLLSVAAGVPLGVLLARFRGGIVDYGIRTFTLSGVALPVFVAGILLQIIFYLVLNWLPVGGRLDIDVQPPPHVTGLYLLDSLAARDWSLFVRVVKHLALPAAALAIGLVAIVIRMTRSTMLEVLGEDYVRTARAKGAGEPRIYFAHALRNALIPTATEIATQTGYLLGGALLVEVVFSWPGLGLYMAQAISALDYNALMGTTLVFAVLFGAVNLLVDLLYPLLDPRIRP